MNDNEQPPRTFGDKLLAYILWSLAIIATLFVRNVIKALMGN